MSITKAIINLKYLKDNLNYLKSLSPESDIYPVIKANAYGHGLEKIGLFLDKLNVKGVCVATINEIEDLVNLNVSYSILHLGKISFSNFKLYKNKNIIATINSIDDLMKISALSTDKSKIRVHIKVDTGMSRMGCSIDQFQNIFDKCLSNENILLEGVYSHLANSENNKIPYNNMQLSLFNQLINSLGNKSENLKIHLLNSGGLLNYANSKFDIIRSGLSIYGISPLGYPHKMLKPVMTLKAPIVHNKNIKKGTMVGYGCNYEAPRDMKISIVQCGYGDGIPFDFSNKGVVFLNNKTLNIVGRVSMDLICIDTSKANCEIGENVIIWGGMLKESKLEYIAKRFNNIPYTFITGLTNRIEREYINE